MSGRWDGVVVRARLDLRSSTVNLRKDHRDQLYSANGSMPSEADRSSISDDGADKLPIRSALYDPPKSTIDRQATFDDVGEEQRWDQRQGGAKYRHPVAQDRRPGRRDVACAKKGEVQSHTSQSYCCNKKSASYGSSLGECPIDRRHRDEGSGQGFWAKRRGAATSISCRPVEATIFGREGTKTCNSRKKP